MSANSKKGLISSQPQGTGPMVAGGSKNALNREIGADGLRDWSFGLFDCFSDWGICCRATWLPCIVYSQNKQHLRHLQYRGTPHRGRDDNFNDDCRFYCCASFPHLCWVLQLGNRSDIRTRYNIRGSTGNDCLTALCCRPCALTQEQREIQLEERSVS